MAGVPELEVDVGPLRRAVDPQLERGAQPRCGLVEGERGGGRACRENVVLDAALGPAEGRAGGEVVCEVGERSARAPRRAFESLADAKMELGASHPGQPVVQRPPHELVGEAVREPGRGELLEHPAADGLVEGEQELGLPEPGRAADDVELELRSGHGCELEQLRRRPAQGVRAAG